MQDAFEETGEKELPNIPERPELRQDLHPVWAAFLTLSTSRQIGMSGVLPIPYSEISRYWYDFRIKDLEEFVFLIQKLDSTYINHSIEQQKKKRSNK